jgi:hypothetical protein
VLAEQRESGPRPPPSRPRRPRQDAPEPAHRPSNKETVGAIST